MADNTPPIEETTATSPLTRAVSKTLASIFHLRGDLFGIELAREYGSATEETFPVMERLLTCYIDNMEGDGHSLADIKRALLGG